jgi:hypothetical protein
MSPLEFMVSVFRDETQPTGRSTRRSAQRGPYCHPRLSTLDIGSREDRPLQVQIVRFSAIDTPPPICRPKRGSRRRCWM